MPLPNLFIIGSARSGTTALHHLLGSHPEVYLPPGLEPRFMAFEGDPLRHTGPGDAAVARRIVTRLADYAALYAHAGAAKVVGDISPAYLSVGGTAERIARHCPEARIIAVLRNPIERAVSSFRLERLAGFEPLDSLGAALAAEPARRTAGWSYVWAYRDRGRYHAQLARYFELFARPAIHVFLYEDWFAPMPLPVRILDMLGLESHLAPTDIARRHNDTGAARFASRGIARFEPDAALLADLREGYRDDIARLEALIRRDLSAWLA